MDDETPYEYSIECIGCGWMGSPDDLHSKTEDINDKDFSYCPDCASGCIEDVD